jgi:hypothetical protein
VLGAFSSPAAEAGGSNDSRKPEPQGAVHWAFRPVSDPPEPPVTGAAWPRTSIDRFVLSRLERVGGAPSKEADRRTLLRRLTFDLTGLPPTPAEMEAFEADDLSGAYDRVVERLLASPRYGERWGRHWLDVVRYADTAGDTADYPVPEAWRYRNYVIEAFNADKPYDQFVREQIAGDILARQGSKGRYAEQVAATGFLAVSRRFGFDSENYQHLTIQDTIDTLGQSVLGLTLGCARCHNHKSDPVSLADYYALYGIFDSTRYAFPGSEQKTRSRSMVPLEPPGEAESKWRGLESRYAELGLKPGAILRSLDEADGDFEMQHVAAGGSYGVLVPPWFSEGAVSVTEQAQSPFRSLHPFGIVGVSIAPGTNAYRVHQTLTHRGPEAVTHVNLDFRVATNGAVEADGHRFLVLTGEAERLLELQVSSGRATLRVLGGNGDEVLPLPAPAGWNSFQARIDGVQGVVTASLAVPGRVESFGEHQFRPGVGARVARVEILGEATGMLPRPGLDVDHVAIRGEPIPPVATDLAGDPAHGNRRVARLNRELESLVGIDGGFEFQTADTAPSKPWHPGPRSAARVVALAQSPLPGERAAGGLGVFLPGGAAYQGLGQTLTNRWQAGTTDRLRAGFDFRCRSEVGVGMAPGTWRFHLGHGSGSAAVELGFGAETFFRRSGDSRDAVGELERGEWYRVTLEADLGARRYSGRLEGKGRSWDFEGRFAEGWDGSIDYVFVDSGGHRSGDRPGVDLDNFICHSGPLSVAGLDAGGTRERLVELRRELAEATAEVDRLKRELDERLASGPVELAYGVTEGTPHDVRIQLRGEPEKPGDRVRRGFPKALGGEPLPQHVQGSGRLELADWLTRAGHPLTGRVMANRLWQYHFGWGLVKTPNDFGLRGEPPIEPALLDHLASRFVKSGWSMKAMHRLIVRSATYRQADREGNGETGVAQGGTGDAGPERDEFVGFRRRRLSAEELRDAILFVSGDLDFEVGRGHPFPSPTSWGFSQHGPFAAVYEHRKRSVYLMTQRLKRHPFLALFDGADPNASTAERRPTTVPTQALFFLNDPFVHARSESLSLRVRAAAAGREDRVRWAYRQVLGRLPEEAELADGVEFLEAYLGQATGPTPEERESAAYAGLARVLFSSNEFLGID